MGYAQKLKDAIAALMMSFTIMITIFQVVNRFMTPLYGSILLVGGLITALVFLFVGEDRRRYMRIASICCNSVAIGAIIGVVFNLAKFSIGLIESIILSAVFLGITFFVYYLFTKFKKRLIPALLGALVVIASVFAILVYVQKYLTNAALLYSIFYAILLTIHYITALVVVKSVSTSIIDGMSYGYFGMTLAILVAVAILILIGSDGEIDASDAILTPLDKLADSHIDPYPLYDMGNVYTGTSRDPHNREVINQSALYVSVLGASVLALTSAELAELNGLERNYKEKSITKRQYMKEIQKYSK